MRSDTMPSASTANVAPLVPLVVDVPTAANLLSVSECTVRREIDRGNLHACRLGRSLRVRITEIEQYLKRTEICS